MRLFLSWPRGIVYFWRDFYVWLDSLEGVEQSMHFAYTVGWLLEVWALAAKFAFPKETPLSREYP